MNENRSNLSDVMIFFCKRDHREYHNSLKQAWANSVVSDQMIRVYTVCHLPNNCSAGFRHIDK